MPDPEAHRPQFRLLNLHASQGQGEDPTLVGPAKLSLKVSEMRKSTSVPARQKFTMTPGFSALPVLTGDDTTHELVKQRHRECSVAVIGAPDHALRDQLASGWAEGRHLSTQLVRNIS